MLDSWIPINKELLEKIQEGLSQGLYELDLDLLVSEIKSDFGLFSFCLKELSQTKRGETSRPLDENLVDFLRKNGLDRLKNILLGQKIKEAVGYCQSNPAAEMRISECIISTTTAELLSERQNIDPEIGYSCAVMRQLGLSLIAWNYPGVFKRVTSSRKADRLDVELSKLLGFSPAMLGLMLARKWKLSPVILHAMGEGSSEKIEQTDMIVKLCEAGEALARANNPKIYPTAQKDWDSCRTYIEAYLGSEGITLVQERVKENALHYASTLPGVFERTQHINPERELEIFQKNQRLSTNSYLNACPVGLRNKFEQLYRQLDSSKIEKENVNLLANIIIPLAGFQSGCVYLIDPGTMMLMPRLKINQNDISEYQPLKVGFGSFDTIGMDPIQIAWSCISPIISESDPIEGLHNGGRRYIASSIGEKKKAGVLYLELADRRFMGGDPLICFKAIKRALEDTLNLI